ncbi:MAG: Gfo/Idh/MocA family oxidoreductase [Acidobacteria bacterium]|nr:Gfo/Idh/MocA family oxidoreductase [Acidobacteriota bacterium]
MLSSRRKFLRAAGASVLGAPALLRAEPRGKVRMGVVGGGFGTSFQWHEHPDCEVVAVSDLRADRRDRLSSVYRCSRTYNELHELIQDKDVEAVAVFTPAPDHVAHAVVAMKAGKHVISAVPAAMNLEECELLLDTVKKTGRIYMMAETGYYHPEIITCRQWNKEGKFGTIFYSEAEYFHDLGGRRAKQANLMYDPDGKHTWRYGFPPLRYITHCSGPVVSVIGERLSDVAALGWGEDHETLRDNVYGNRFVNSVALFKTSGGNSSRICVHWSIALGGAERASFYGTEMSFQDPMPGGQAAMVGRPEKMEPWQRETHWETLPEPLRRPTGHKGSHTFLTHEFVRAVIEQRWPAVNVYEALAFTAPGIIADRSAREGGKWMKVPDYGRA